jgi:hypothetical protein
MFVITRLFRSIPQREMALPGGEVFLTRVGVPAKDTLGFMIFKRPGRRAEIRFMPGCFIWSIVLSIGLTILINVLIRAL